MLSCSVLSDSLWPRGLEPARLLCPWDSPGKNTGVGCHALLQGIFPTRGWNLGLLHCTWTLFCLSHLGSPKAKRGWLVCGACLQRSTPINNIVGQLKFPIIKTNKQTNKLKKCPADPSRLQLQIKIVSNCHVLTTWASFLNIIYHSSYLRVFAFVIFFCLGCCFPIHLVNFTFWFFFFFRFPGNPSWFIRLGAPFSAPILNAHHPEDFSSSPSLWLCFPVGLVD